MTGNTSLYHLINHSLMAELEGFQSEEVFREIWRFWHAEEMLNQARFLHPQKAFELVNLPYSTELLRDWETLYKVSQSISLEAPLKESLIMFPTQHRLRFFMILMWQVLHLQFYLLNYIMENEASIKHRQYLLMDYYSQLEQFIKDNNRHIAKGKELEIRKTYQQLLVFFWIKNYAYQQEYIHPQSLHFFKDEMKAIFIEAIPSCISPLHQYLSAQLKTKAPLSEEDFKEKAPLEIIQSLQPDIATLKTQVEQIHLKNQLEMSSQDYIKPKKAAELLGISVSTLNCWRKQGKFKQIRKVGNRYEFSLVEIEGF